MAENVTKVDSLPSTGTAAASDQLLMTSGSTLKRLPVSALTRKADVSCVNMADSFKNTWVRIAEFNPQNKSQSALFMIDQLWFSQVPNPVILAVAIASAREKKNATLSTVRNICGQVGVIQKARVVYHETTSDQPVYLEVYVNGAGAGILVTSTFLRDGSLVKPTAGSIPTGYAAKEFVLSAVGGG